MLRLKSSRTPGLRLLRTWPITVAGGEGEGEFWYDGDILWKGEDKEHEIVWTWSRCQFYLTIHDNTCRSMSWLRVAWDWIWNCFSNMLHVFLFFLIFYTASYASIHLLKTTILETLPYRWRCLKKKVVLGLLGSLWEILLGVALSQKKSHLPNPANLDSPVVWPRDGYGSCKSWPDDADIGKEGEVRSPQERCGCYRAEEMGRTDSPL